MSLIASLVTAIMLGSLSAIVPGLNPIAWIYRFVFGSDIPDYLNLAFGAIGNFTLIYSLVAILISPISCRMRESVSQLFEEPSKEDWLYVPMLYAVYLYVIYVNGMFTYEAALIGVFAVMIPLVYRSIVYSARQWLSEYRSSCSYDMYVFLTSLIASFAVTVGIMLIARVVVSILVDFNVV